jgi:hypothetical protein
MAVKDILTYYDTAAITAVKVLWYRSQVSAVSVLESSTLGGRDECSTTVQPPQATLK